MNNFETTFAKLYNENKLILFKHCSSAWQKSFIKSLEEGRAVVDFADPLIREQAVNYTQAFVQGIDRPALLYNLQLVPDLLPVLTACDVPNVSYIAVTDQAHYLMPKLERMQTMAMLELPLAVTGKQPFVPGQSVSEEQKDVIASIFAGSLYVQDTDFGEDRKRFYASYVKNIVQHKIMEQTTVSDDIKFYRFLCMAASLTGTVVNYSSLANGVGITAPTAKQ